ncbi:MAG: amino acid adenylation domain-containing protein, partial [Halanaerobiales bacterium]|nr:amino acid adenylation domain-containing protein [Halanaerobiales bacterium]
DKLDLKRDLSRNPLFDTMFVLQNTDTTEDVIENLKFIPYQFENKIAKLDLALNATETNNGIGFTLEYRTKLFKKETIERMAEHFIQVISQVVNEPEVVLADISMVNEEELHKLLYDFNNTEVEYPKNKNIAQMFEDQVDRIPDQTAIVFEDHILTYLELNEKSNQLARKLRKKGVQPEKIIGIIVERSLEMSIGILAILKAGGAYLPIDSEYPKDRIHYMLKDSNIDLLLTQQHLREQIEFAGKVIELDDAELYTGDTSNLETLNELNDLAYIIYTSGTTGKPKGVMIEHGSIANTIHWWKNEYQMDSTDHFLLLNSFGFDAFVVVFFGPLASGAQLVFTQGESAKEPAAIKNYIKSKAITYLSCVPSLYTGILECLTAKAASSLKVVILGGEKINPKLIDMSKKLNEDLELVNEYGPTENSVISTVCRNLKIGSQITIGKPIANTHVYILDRKNQLVPVGVTGELCLSGYGLARGYLNQLELTSEKFVLNQYTNERMYKTGDLARWLPDGNIEFLGRVDHQVKIRGFRIELGEIESKLLDHVLIKDVVVVDRVDANENKYLAAYIVSDEKLSVLELREYLGKELPDYMIPSYFIKLDQIPLTPNGKIDKKALPKPDDSIKTGREYVAPRNEIEEKLIGIWSEVLVVENIGINDNFFELGGHSLKATSFVAKAFKEFNVELPLSIVFKTPILKELAEYIRGEEKTIYASIEPVDEKEYKSVYPVSSAQKRLFILNQFESDSTNYNMPGIMYIEGNLDEEHFKETFHKLAQRHEAFRT